MSNAILVVGGGFSGLTAALEAAEVGYDVFIVEKSPFLGGRVAQLSKYFPKLCPPSCGLEIQFQRIKNNPRIKFFTQASVTAVKGKSGDYTVSIHIVQISAHLLKSSQVRKLMSLSLTSAPVNPCIFRLLLPFRQGMCLMSMD